MDTEQLEKTIEELAKPVLLQDRQNKIIKNLHLIIFKFIIICATIAIVASFAYTRITRKNSTESADIAFNIFFIFSGIKIIKSKKMVFQGDL